jgi:uncharacterized protein (TIGR00369 family)
VFDPTNEKSTTQFWTERSRGRLPGLVGLELTGVGEGFAEGRLPVRPHLLAPNGYLHAATVIALADTLCGFGCSTNLPEGATGFTTIELKANFLGTATDGLIAARATMLHGGRTTQVWDATVTHNETGRTIAVFRCTQLVLWPKA